MVFRLKIVRKTRHSITTAYQDTRKELQESKNIIAGLQNQIQELNTTISSLNARIEQGNIDQNNKVVAFSRIAKEAKIRYTNLNQIGFSKVLTTNDFIKIDAIPVATISWRNSVSDSLLFQQEAELQNWLQQEMKLDTLFVRRLND